MPILDPSLQAFLANPPKQSNGDTFFLRRYLRIASRNKARNITTLETYSKFQKDLTDNIATISDIFGDRKEFKNFKITCNIDYYKYINDILELRKENSTSLEGKYYLLNDKYYSTKIFQPYAYLHDQYSWYFSDTPIAILGINFHKLERKYLTKIYNLIQLEIDLMLASGFTLILCTFYSIENRDFLFNLIQNNQFSEIHLNILSSSDLENFLRNIKKSKFSYLKLYKGYFYLYSPYIQKVSSCREIFKKLKARPRFSIISYSDNPLNCLNLIDSNEIKPFAYCKTGFKCQNLCIKLSNVPIYDFEDSQLFVPTRTSGTTICYISKSDFFERKNNRVKILFEDDFNKGLTKKYVNFEDIHKIRKDLYVKDTLYLAKIDEETRSNIDNIEKNIIKIIKQRKNKRFKKSSIFSFSKDKLIVNSIEYVTYAYTYVSHSLENEFSIHRPQIYTVLEASKKFIKNDININGLLEKEISLNEFQSLDTDELLKILPNEEKEIINYLKENQQQILELSHSEINELSQSIFDDDSYLLKYIKKDKNNFINEILLDKKKFYEKQFLEKKKNYEKILLKQQLNQNKGVIYQVDTGEGKSCIVSIIAAILALNGKTVHITSSNINLANRDYMNSFDFFKLLKLKSAVLLHDNELPIAPKKNLNKSSSSKSSVPSKNNEKNDVKFNFDEFFKDNMMHYFESSTNDDKTDYPRYYYDKDLDYYNEYQFFNSSRMNFCVCGLDSNNEKQKNKPNIIFSTFVNFECFYLKMMELCPGYIDEYFNNCALLIDEADSILIDEIANGTIISRQMKSDSKQILKFIYDSKKSGFSPEKTFNFIKNEWPKCVDLTLNDIKKMFSEIDLVNQPEFRNGRKYSIETFEVKNNKKKEDLFEKVINASIDFGSKIIKGLIKEFTPDNKNGEEEDSDNDDDDEYEDEEDENNEAPTTIFRHIVPFDYDHKGILEPNKEFNGFIQQFIAIKESENKENENMIVKEMSMSYLYVSHPIFVNLYSKVFGFTGTIGNEKEKQIYKNQYNLETLRIPRNEPNQRVEFPMILCDSIEERNQKIIFEILQFNKKGNPVLVIFQDLKEIDIIIHLLRLKGINYVNVFDGKNEIVKPDLIAGLNSAISLGTNVCGRGTNIKVRDKPLHVIVSYYTSNIRVMNQACGRTARQGQKGTSRIICLKEQFLSPVNFSFEDNGIEAVIEEFYIKNQLQTEYINFFKDTKPWVFSNDVSKQIINDDDILKLREARINVNRIIACNFDFPFKMSIKTFLKIQEQKIFSIFNCPNSKYTWRLFQKYVREMILESWSLMINKVDEEFYEKKENIEYKKEIDELKELHLSAQSVEYQEKRKKINIKFSKNIEQYKNELIKGKNELMNLLKDYLPINITNIVPTFMFIFGKVTSQYQNDVLGSFKSLSNAYLQYNKIGFMSCQIGFKPYSLLSKSGARISYKNLNQINYIQDPELKYLKRQPNNHICLLSITEKIDDIFNIIFQRINKFLGGKTFLKLFMRRTLCGCEFGICLNFPLLNEGINDPNCIIDKDPLLLFTISVRSIIPILAGILIILLVYIASISKKIGEWFVNFPKKFTEEVVLRGIGVIVNIVVPELMNFALDKVIKFLRKTLKNQLEILKKSDNENAKLASTIISTLMEVFNSSIYEVANSKVPDFLGKAIKVTINWQKFIKNCVDSERIMKISLLLLLCLATFIMNFNTHKNAIEKAKNDSNEYEKAFKKGSETIDKTIINLCEKEKKEVNDKNIQVKDDLNERKRQKELGFERKSQIEEYTKNVMNSYLYQFKSYDIFEKIIRFTKFIEDNQHLIECFSNAIADIKYYTQKKSSKKYLRLCYNGFRKAFIQSIRIYGTNQYPSILPIIGYSIHKQKQFIFVEAKEKGSLESVINNSHHKKLSNSSKLIIAYGIAHAFKYLHGHNIVHRNLNTANILIDSHFHPFVYEFYYAKQIDTPLPYCLKNAAIGFMAPEFISDYKANQNSFKIDVYAYGITLLCLITECNHFNNNLNPMEFKVEFPKNTNLVWKELIDKCLNIDPSKRPTFIEICEYLEINVSKIDSGNSKDFNSYKKLFQSD